VQCNAPISALSWSKENLNSQNFDFLQGDHLLSIHEAPDFEVKTWQINRYKNEERLKFWFSKVHELPTEHSERIVQAMLSPSGK